VKPGKEKPHEDTGKRSPGRHCHSTLALAGIDLHSLGIYTVISLALLSFSVKMTVSSWARQAVHPVPGVRDLRRQHVGGAGLAPGESVIT
jgi:hypothetical protein